MFSLPLSILILHFLGDFLLQSDWMALNKSKHWDPLIIHAAIYSLCFLAWGWPFVGVTCATHALTDAVTSRLTASLWFIDLADQVEVKGVSKDMTFFEFARVNSRKRHWFFVVIGVDQLLHFTTLALTLKLLNL